MKKAVLCYTFKVFEGILKMDEQKRIELQQLFKKGLENLNILKPGDEGYVCKLQANTNAGGSFVNTRKIKQITLREFNERVEKFKSSIKRKVWSPVIGNKQDISAQQSKYFGNPWCYKGSKWPIINGVLQPLFFKLIFLLFQKK